MSDTAETFTDYLVMALTDHIREHGNEVDLVVKQDETEIVWVDAADKRFWLITVSPAHVQVGTQE